MTLHRKTPLKRNRRANLKPRKAINKRNAKRQAREFARTYGSQDRKRWIASHPCLVCFRYPSENAHAKGDGGSRKGDARLVVPLCHHHHIEVLHRIGVESFERMFATELESLTLVEWAAHFEAEWRRFSGLEPVGAIVPRVLAELGEDAE